MSDTTYKGHVSFDGWEWPNGVARYTPDEFALSVQEGFKQVDLNHFSFSQDGLNVRFILDCLNGGDIPTFSASIESILGWAIEEHLETHEDDRNDIGPLLAELKRCVARIEALTSKEPDNG